MHPSIASLLAFFDASHLHQPLAEVVRPFVDLAQTMAQVPGPETAAGLRKLLEAKDCAVRAVVAARKAG